MNEILIIDDEEDFGYFVKSNLQLNDEFHVSVATDGKTGLKMAEEGMPDLILLDVMMPRMDGLQVLKKLKGNKKTQKIPVIMLTAKNDEESIAEAIGSFSEQYIIKPIEMTTLENKVRMVLRNHGLYPSEGPFG
jgi:two-component system alkaline phosphatase synthesis response regulator PhoP